MIDFACKKFNLKEVVQCSLGLSKTEFNVFEYLMCGKEMTTKELAKTMQLGLSTVQKVVKKLKIKELLEKSQKNLSKGGYVYIYKIKNRDLLRLKMIMIIENWCVKVKSELKNW